MIISQSAMYANDDAQLKKPFIVMIPPAIQRIGIAI
jgi:hypothetical protein